MGENVKGSKDSTDSKGVYNYSFGIGEKKEAEAFSGKA